MQGFDVNRFVAERSPSWSRLEELLGRVEHGGLGALNLAAAREFGKLYRSVSSDLIRARTEELSASLIDYLNDVVARSYAVMHAGPRRADRRLLRFLTHGFPRLFRREWRAIALAAVVLFSGALVGAVAVAGDPDALGALIPEQHQAHTPGERVSGEEVDGGGAEADQAAAFSGFLFTHNIRVSFVVFALGVTFGVGTLALLFYNGVPLGALAMQYHGEQLGTFFWAWILPHGVPELTEVCVAGGAGLIIARGLWLPGRRRRRDALIAETRTAVALVLGGMPILVVAGLIEGTISQVHEPQIPYAAKLAFAAVVAVLLFGYLALGGRSELPADRE